MWFGPLPISGPNPIWSVESEIWNQPAKFQCGIAWTRCGTIFKLEHFKNLCVECPLSKQKVDISTKVIWFKQWWRCLFQRQAQRKRQCTPILNFCSIFFEFRGITLKVARQCIVIFCLHHVWLGFSYSLEQFTDHLNHFYNGHDIWSA